MDESRIARGRLGYLRRIWSEINATTSVRDQAERLVRLHDLRASDAFQLGAAIIASRHQPAAIEIVCLDHRLTVAAGREGFAVVA
ncbi:MAG: type II toxin-antitoxin system VapC family toxin [Alphaproteobacteria bacterium]|nr:type II toxin-antitoxin system VapC family toxin [Alphaproteobacteria bacterium]